MTTYKALRQVSTNSKELELYRACYPVTMKLRKKKKTTGKSSNVKKLSNILLNKYGSRKIS